MAILLLVTPGARAEDAVARCAAGDLVQCIQAAREAPHPARASSLLSWACDQGEPEACLELAFVLERLATQLPPQGYPCRVEPSAGLDGWPAQFTYQCRRPPRPAAAVTEALQRACRSGSQKACDLYVSRLPPASLPKQRSSPVERSQLIESIHRLPRLGSHWARRPFLALDGEAGVAWWVDARTISARALATGELLAPAPPLDADGVWAIAAAMGTDGQPRILVKVGSGLSVWSPLAGAAVPLQTGTQTVCSMAFSGSGRQVAISLGTTPPDFRGCPPSATGVVLEAHDAMSGQRLWTRPLEFPAGLVAASADGAVIAAAEELGPRVILASRDRVRTWRVPKDERPLSLAMDPTGQRVAIRTHSTLWLLDWSGRARSLGSRLGAAFTPSGDRLLLLNAGSLELARPSDGKALEPPTAFGLPKPPSTLDPEPPRIAFTADGKTALLIIDGQVPALVRLRGGAPLPQPGESSVQAVRALRPFEVPALPPQAPRPPAEWSLSGVVLRDGRPVPAVEVTMAPERSVPDHLGVASHPGLAPRQVRTGPDGRFQADGLWRVWWSIRARAPGFVSGGISPGPDATHPVTLNLAPAVVLKGRITAQGQPAGEQWVNVEQRHGLFARVRSGRDGAWRVDSLPPETQYFVRVTTADGRHAEAAVEAGPPGERTVNLDLSRPGAPGALVLRAASESGKPAAGVRVSLFDLSLTRQTDPEGLVSFSVPLDRDQVSVHFGTGTTDKIQLSMKERPAVVPFTVMKGALGVRGAGDGKLQLRSLATGQKVQAEPTSPWLRGLPGDTDTWFTRLPAGAYRLSLHPDANAAPRYLELRLGPDESKEVSAGDLVEVPRVQGRLVWLGTEAPVTGATLKVRCDVADGARESLTLVYCDASAVTGPDGAFELAGLEPGRHFVRLSGPGIVFRKLVLDVTTPPGPLTIEAWPPRTHWVKAGAPAAGTEPPEAIDLVWTGLELKNESEGLRVTAVRGSASTPPIQVGDLIVGVNGHPLKTPIRHELFTSALDSPRPPKLEISRGSSKLEAVLSPRPDLGSLSLPWWP